MGTVTIYGLSQSQLHFPYRLINTKFELLSSVEIQQKSTCQREDFREQGIRRLF